MGSDGPFPYLADVPPRAAFARHARHAVRHRASLRPTKKPHEEAFLHQERSGSEPRCRLCLTELSTCHCATPESADHSSMLVVAQYYPNPILPDSDSTNCLIWAAGRPVPASRESNRVAGGYRFDVPPWPMVVPRRPGSMGDSGGVVRQHQADLPCQVRSRVGFAQ